MIARRHAGRGTAIALYGCLALYVAIVLVPFYWMVKAAISTPDDLFRLPVEYLPRPDATNLLTLAGQIPQIGRAHV